MHDEKNNKWNEKNIDNKWNVMSKLWKQKFMNQNACKIFSFTFLINCECNDVDITLYACMGVWGFAILTHDINLSFAYTVYAYANIFGANFNFTKVYTLHSPFSVRCK